MTLLVVLTIAFVALSVLFGTTWSERTRHKVRVKAMWTELAARASDHGPLSSSEIAEVVAHWVGE
jgi:hypothetical protein